MRPWAGPNGTEPRARVRAQLGPDVLHARVVDLVKGAQGASVLSGPLYHATLQRLKHLNNSHEMEFEGGGKDNEGSASNMGLLRHPQRACQGLEIMVGTDGTNRGVGEEERVRRGTGCCQTKTGQ